jgi:hypothetical protein
MNYIINKIVPSVAQIILLFLIFKSSIIKAKIKSANSLPKEVKIARYL